MQNLPYWELRLGIHTGPLDAGVVGHKKFAYDVWGDTVNTASRMESSGTTGRIKISGETYEQVKFLFDCEHRGQVAAKNKGMIDMYYLNGIKHKFSVGGEGGGRVPNSRFKEVYTALARGAKLVARPGGA
jgi:class 3 adenylate cyclase